MKYIIDLDILKKNNLDMAEFGLLLYFAGGGGPLSSNKVCDSLWRKGYLIKTGHSGNEADNYSFDSFAFEELQNILSEGSNKPTVNQRAEKLAPLMRALYPEGYKEIFIGGIRKKYPWRDSDRIISGRMKTFFKRYGDKYTDDQILDATRRYCQGNSDDNTYMKLLKYFIFKDVNAHDAQGNGYTNETSDLLAFIENPELIGGSTSDIGELI